MRVAWWKTSTRGAASASYKPAREGWGREGGTGEHFLLQDHYIQADGMGIGIEHDDDLFDQPVQNEDEGDQDQESSSAVIKWHQWTKAKRTKFAQEYPGFEDPAVKPWTTRAQVQLRGLPKQLTPEWCFQNEYTLVQTQDLSFPGNPGDP